VRSVRVIEGHLENARARVRELVDADGARKILCFDPTLAAADHAAEQDVLLAGCQPDADLGP
jgi:hypothetical protein